MTPQGGFNAFTTPLALRASADCVFNIAPEGLSDVEVVYIWFAEYVVYSF